MSGLPPKEVSACFPYTGPYGKTVYPGLPVFLLSSGPAPDPYLEQVVFWIWTPDKIIEHNCAGFLITFKSDRLGKVIGDVTQQDCERDLSKCRRLGTLDYSSANLKNLQNWFETDPMGTHWSGTVEAFLKWQLESLHKHFTPDSS